MYCPLVHLIGSLPDQGLDSLLGRVDRPVRTRNLPGIRLWDPLRLARSGLDRMVSSGEVAAEWGWAMRPRSPGTARAALSPVAATARSSPPPPESPKTRLTSSHAACRGSGHRRAEKNAWLCRLTTICFAGFYEGI